MTTLTPPGGTLPVHRLDVPAPDILPFAIGTFDTIGPLSRADFPHRHTFYELVYVTGGSGQHVVDLRPSRLRPPHLCCVAPGQVHHWHDARELRGWVLLFTDEFLLDHPGDAVALRDLGDRPRLPLDAAAAIELAAVVADMRREFRLRRAGFISVLQAYLHVLVVRASRLPTPVEPDMVPGPRAAVARRFLRLLAAPHGTPRSVREVAARVGVSVGHLNDEVKRATGRTPGQHLRHAQTLAAKRLLACTDLTVRQVAHEVGFEDPAYFCRFFRRETGSSPGDFRRTAGVKHHDGRLVSIDPGQPSA